jgi:hypothetical protein
MSRTTDGCQQDERGKQLHLSTISVPGRVVLPVATNLLCNKRSEPPTGVAWRMSLTLKMALSQRRAGFNPPALRFHLREGVNGKAG